MEYARNVTRMITIFVISTNQRVPFCVATTNLRALNGRDADQRELVQSFDDPFH